jgi:hypothetical protein
LEHRINEDIKADQGAQADITSPTTTTESDHTPVEKEEQASKPKALSTIDVD